MPRVDAASEHVWLPESCHRMHNSLSLLCSNLKHMPPIPTRRWLQSHVRPASSQGLVVHPLEDCSSVKATSAPHAPPGYLCRELPQAWELLKLHGPPLPEGSSPPQRTAAASGTAGPAFRVTRPGCWCASGGPSTQEWEAPPVLTSTAPAAGPHHCLQIGRLRFQL